MTKFGISILSLVAVPAMSLIAQSKASSPSVEFRNSPEIASPSGYSHAVVVSGGKMVFLAGQVGMNKQGEMVGKDDFHAQAAQVFVNLRSALAAVGASPKDVV